MKTAALFAIVLLFCSLSNAQTLVDRTFLMRAETTVVDAYTGMSHTCILVMPDGHYRLEKSFQGNQGGGTDEKVYVDTLPDTNLKQLQSILDESKFQAIQTAEPKGGIIQNMDTLYVTIPRERNMQNLAFMNAAERHPYEKDLKPFQNWMKDIQKRKVQQAKGEKGNNCSAPKVLYRTTSMDPTMGDSDNQH
jgi:hypothetical protein